MRPTIARLVRDNIKNPGFLRRSIEEFQYETRKIIRGEYAGQPYEDLYLFDSENQITRERTKVMCDSEAGGFSRVNFDIIDNRPPTDDPPPKHYFPSREQRAETSLNPLTYAHFHGNISTQLPANKAHIQRSGYAGWRTLEQKYTLWGNRYYDIDMFPFIAFRVKSDGRNYFVNVQTDSIEERDLHQHKLITKNPGEWETVLIAPSEFVRTSYGWVVQDQKTILAQRLKTIGISVIDRLEGPFDLKIHSIFATNVPPKGAFELVKDGKSEDLDWGPTV